MYTKTFIDTLKAHLALSSNHSRSAHLLRPNHVGGGKAGSQRDIKTAPLVGHVGALCAGDEAAVGVTDCNIRR